MCYVRPWADSTLNKRHVIRTVNVAAHFLVTYLPPDEGSPGRREYPLLVRAFLMAVSPIFHLEKCDASSRYDICLASGEERTNSSNSSICVELSFGGAPLLFFRRDVASTYSISYLC